jgi:hypothetical protein
MQYVQRKLHLSVTETRTDLISRPQESRSGSTFSSVRKGFARETNRKMLLPSTLYKEDHVSGSDFEQQGGGQSGGGQEGGGGQGGGGGESGGGGGESGGGMGGGGGQEGGGGDGGGGMGGGTGGEEGGSSS